MNCYIDYLLIDYSLMIISSPIELIMSIEFVASCLIGKNLLSKWLIKVNID